jgi:hypothetical protein
MPEPKFQWRAIQRIRDSLVGFDSKMRERYDRSAFRTEFRELRDHAKECGLGYYQKLFEAKAAYHTEEYARAYDLALQATKLVLGQRPPARFACDCVKECKAGGVLRCVSGGGHCCSKGAEPSKASILRETLKDLPIAYGLIATSKLHLAIASGRVAHLDQADKAIASVFRLIAPKSGGKKLHNILIDLAEYSSKQRIELCCGYPGSDRRNYQDLYVTACRIVQLRIRLNGKRGRHKLTKTLDDLLPAKNLAIYAEGHPWLRTFAADASQTTNWHAAKHHYKEILDDVFARGYTPTHLREYYDEIRTKAKPAAAVAPGKVYASVRLARLEFRTAIEDKAVREDNAVLDELRFDFDGMFWSVFQAEQRFARFLRHPRMAEDLPGVTQDKLSPGSQAMAVCSMKSETPRHGKSKPIQVDGGADQTDADVFCVLRSWSSFTPFLPQQWASNREARFTSRGGGYLLRWKGHGIAVDPGPSFIRNLYETGFKVDDIDTVIVTHNHPDHTYEVESVLNLASRAGHRISTFLLSKNANAGLANKVSMSSPTSEIVVFGPGNTWILESDESRLTIRGLVAHHADIGSSGTVSAFGVAFHEQDLAGERVLAAVSSDTHWCRTVEESFASLKNAEIFVAHVSRVEFDEMCEPGRYYSKHLGILGAFRALKAVHPRVGVLSEWGEELAGYRAPIAAAVQRALRVTTSQRNPRPCCLPGDRGLKFEFDSSRRAYVSCSFPQQRRDFDECGEPIEPKDVVIDAHVDDGEHRIHYLCPIHHS